MSLVTRKTPVPMVSPITIATADQRPSPRINSEGVARAAREGRLALIEVHRAYYRRRGGSIGCLLAAKTVARYHQCVMATQQPILSEFPWNSRFNVSGSEDVLTPALLVYPQVVAANIECTLKLLGGDASRWRAHIKTAKLGYTLRLMVDRSIRNFKCATTLELLVACECGAEDVLVAYPTIGANARRMREIAQQFPHIRISVLAENEEQIR